jgi:hypothetical protein
MNLTPEQTNDLINKVGSTIQGCMGETIQQVAAYHAFMAKVQLIGGLVTGIILIVALFYFFYEAKHNADDNIMGTCAIISFLSAAVCIPSLICGVGNLAEAKSPIIPTIQLIHNLVPLAPGR